MNKSNEDLNQTMGSKQNLSKNFEIELEGIYKIQDIAVKPKYWKKDFSHILYQNHKYYHAYKQKEKEWEQYEFD